jgi:glycosyltransferase 2 family protein
VAVVVGAPQLNSNDMRNKQAWRRWARIILSATALLAIFLATSLTNVFAALARADVALIALGVALNFATRLAAAERTFAISRGVGLPLNRWQTVESMFISNFWSLALPGLSAGSVVTVYRYTRYGVPLADGLGVLSASRAIELAVFCVLGAIAFALSSSAPNPEVIALLSLAPLLILGVFLVAPRVVSRASQSAGEKKSSMSAIGRLKHVGARALVSFTGAPRKEFLAAGCFALIQCALDAASVMALAWSLGFSIDWLDALWINVLAYLAILLPISVAGLGVREAAVIVALTPLGVPSDGAVALALLMFTATLFNALAGGVLQLLSGADRRTAPKHLPSGR